MKSIIFAVFLLIFSFTVNAQETKDTSQDVVLNPIFAVLGAVHLSYDYNFSGDKSFGATVFYQFADLDKENFGKGNFMIKPQYRYYFGQKPNSGFFIEGFGVYRRDTYDKEVSYVQNNYTYTNTEKAKVTAFGLGFGAGGKWLVKRNYVIEASAGVHRNFTDVKEYKTAGLGMLGIGRRF